MSLEQQRRISAGMITAATVVTAVNDTDTSSNVLDDPPLGRVTHKKLVVRLCSACDPSVTMVTSIKPSKIAKMGPY